MAEYTLGLDLGSRAVKAALFDPKRGRVAAAIVRDGTPDKAADADTLLRDILAAAGIGRDGLRRIVATGYGRSQAAFADEATTEISCHAAGVAALHPEVRTVIDIGGQDSKAIVLAEGGRVRDFAMNDRCAAGSGRFLEVVAARLGVDLSTLGELSRHSHQAALISSMCVVFAETEIIGLLAEGVAPADIAAGVQNAIALRVATLAGRMVTQPVCFTGGVALQSGMVRALETALSCAVCVPSLPQYTGALGAAILASRQSRTQPSL